MGDALTAAVRENFSAARALSFGFDVIRRRPGTFLRLSLIQAVAFTIPGLAMVYVMGVFGGQLNATGADPADLLRAQGLMMLAFMPIYLAFIAVMIWVEAYWLELFLKDRVTFAPPPGRALWLLLSFIVCGILFFAAYVIAILGVTFAAVLAIAAESMTAAVLIMGIGFLGFVVFLLLVMARLTALPALSYLECGFSLAKAWRAAGVKLGSLILAWLGFGTLYLVLAVGNLIVLWITPLPYGAAIRYQLENPDNPYAQYEIYAQLTSDPGQIAALAAYSLVSGVVFAALSAISRGIGVVLALAASPEA